MNKLSTTFELLLLATVLSMVVSTTSSGILLVNASTTTEGGDDSGGDEGGSNDDGNNDNGDGDGNGDSGQPEPEPEPEPETPPMQTDEPPAPAETLPETALIPEQPEPIECPEGYFLSDTDKCVPDPLTELGELVGPPPECTPEQTSLECLEEITKEPLPYCDTPEAEGAPACHDLQDYDEETGLYPCNDGTQAIVPEECPNAYEPPLENQTDPSPLPYPSPEVEVDVGDNTTDPGDNGTDPIPTPPNGNGTNGNDTNGDIDIDIIIKNINKNVFNNEKNHHHESFPEIDIIGLSTKQNGDSMVCLINIDNENVQCQEYGMPSNRVNDDFWRVIETDHDKDYDNGNTGSNDIDGVIDDIKSQDFSELDDATNHDFGIDLAWIAINPSGDGVACLAEDSTGKGKSLCEPFKVSSEEIDGQITEGVKFKNT